MQQVLIEKLHKYIIQNNVDLLIALQQQSEVSKYLNDKVESVTALIEEMLLENTPAYIIEERCMDELTKAIRPSKFNYLTSILEKEFGNDFNRLEENGILTYEVVNLIEECKPVFETIGFTEENENDKHLHYAITGSVKEYLESKQ